MRLSDGDNDYEITADKIQAFEEDLDRLFNSSEFSDGWYELCSEFDEKYGEYQI